MTDRYTDENGQPRFGVRVSPEELERIRREQGVAPASAPAGSAGGAAGGPDAAASSAPPVPQAPGTAQAPAGSGEPDRPGAPTGQPRYGQVAPGGHAGAPGAHGVPGADGPGRATASSPYQAGRTESGLAAPPPGGWSWQREPGAGRGRHSLPPAAEQQPGQAAGQQPGQPSPYTYGAGGPQGYTSVYGTGGPGQGGARRPHRWRALVLGLVLLLLVPAALTGVAVSRVVDGPLTSAAVLSTDGQVYLDQGAHVGLYATASEAAVGQCEVRAPSGASVDVVTLDEDLGVAGSSEAAAGSLVAPPYASLTAPETGTYTLACPGGTTGVVVGPALSVDKAVGAGWLMIGAFVSGLAGLVLTVVGIVRAVRRG